eukprot:479484-Pleurochrysis_carterae.AAC.1
MLPLRTQTAHTCTHTHERTHTRAPQMRLDLFTQEGSAQCCADRNAHASLRRRVDASLRRRVTDSCERRENRPRACTLLPSVETEAKADRQTVTEAGRLRG